MLRVGGLVAKSTGAIDAAEQDLQNVNHSARMETIRVRRDSTHGVHADWATNGLCVMTAVGVNPWDVEAHFLVESCVCEFGCDTLDGFGINADNFSNGLGRIFRLKESFCQQLKDCCRDLPVGKFDLAEDSRLDACLMGWSDSVCVSIENQNIAR